MNNVVSFPRGKKDTPPQSLEDTLKMVEENRKQHIENVLDNLIPHFVNVIHDEGFDVTKDHMAIPLSYFVEVVRGVLYTSMNLDHPITENAKEFFKNSEESVEEA